MKRFLPFAFLIVVLNSYSVVHPDQKSGNTETTTKTEQRGTDEQPLTVKIQPSHEAEENTKKEEEYRKEKADEDRTLTKATVCLAAITGILAFFTALLWVATYCLAKDAKVSGERQSKEMEKSLGIARDAADAAKNSIDAYKNAERAWVSWSGVDISIVTNGKLLATGKTSNGVMFAIKWRNAGRTPAVQCQVSSDGKIMSIDNDIPVFEPVDSGDQHGFTLIPGIPSSGHPAFFTDDDIVKLKDRECRIFLYGRFDYKVPFAILTDQVLHSETCIEVKYAGIDPRTNEIQFSFMPKGRQNSAT